MYDLDNFTGYKILQAFQKSQKDGLLITESESVALETYAFLRLFLPNNCYFLPNFDVPIYDKISPTLKILIERAQILGALTTNSSPKLLITTANNFYRRLAPKSFFQTNATNIKPNVNLVPQDLVHSLVNNGFYRVATVNAPAEFAWRGDIIDICICENQAYRIYFDWDQVTKIKVLDIADQRSLQEVTELNIFPITELTLNSQALDAFKANCNNKLDIENDLFHYSNIIKGRKFPGIENIWPLFFNSSSTIIDYLNSPLIWADCNITTAYNKLQRQALEDFAKLSQTTSLISSFENLFLNDDEIKNLQISPLEKVKQASLDQNFYFQSKRNLPEAVKLACRFMSDKLHKTKIILAFNSSKNIEYIKQQLKEHNLQYKNISTYNEAEKNCINLYLGNLKSIVLEEVIIIEESNIIGFEQSKISANKTNKLQNFMLELNNFEPGEIVVHKDYGIAKFLGIEVVKVENIVHDYVKLLYADDDKVYIPVENIETIKKFGDGNPNLDKLGIANWQKRKASLKNKISAIAAQLIKTAALRSISDKPPIIINQDHYEKFCKLFPYIETQDQQSAINDVYEDLSTGKLLDRLICGDVGYGKTEVAMRASFLVFDDDKTKQVAIVSPTTVLARQHYISFQKRFSDFSVRIAQLSRFVSPKEQKEVKEKLKNGDIDIVIGTHALFANNLEFKNLGLIIIDEEHQFGVKQKEKLKNIKKDCHVLALSATPIPRTLQMSLVGIKDMSIIATPPFERVAVKTFLLEQEDSQAISDAIARELSRNGKIFYVVPRLEDLENAIQKLKLIDPHLKARIAHGQMRIAELDEVLSDFYDGKFDILVSTNIVQSGLDVPGANTIIIDSAHMFGLSQLHQLKGRVGRKDLQGYCYLISKLDKIGSLGHRRLQIIQSTRDLGAGFNIASYDIDLRGYGNLLGDEQSGHIKEIGVELYQEMLREEISKLKNNSTAYEDEDYTPVLNLGMPIHIPETYINEENLRLLIYRRIAQLKSEQECQALIAELNDRFGQLPMETRNLFDIVGLKQTCKNIKISTLDLGPKGLVIKFHQRAHLDKMIEFVNKFPKHSKIRNDGSLVILKQIAPQERINQITNILQTLDKFIHD